MSSRDMWQPKQPASEVVAIFSFGAVASFMAPSWHVAARSRLPTALIGAWS